VQFISSDAAGHLFSIPFLDRDGRTWRQRLTGPSGAIPRVNSGALLFSVSFQTADFQPLRIGTRSSFDFHVTKTPDGFKVLDLPPRSE
jgi:hypothetical protein